MFLTCSGYGLPPKERCVKTMNLVLTAGKRNSEFGKIYAGSRDDR